MITNKIINIILRLTAWGAIFWILRRYAARLQQLWSLQK